MTRRFRSLRAGGFRASNATGRASRAGGRAGFQRATPSAIGSFVPSSLSGLQLWSVDGTGVRYTNGTARLVDQSRAGTVRQIQPGRCYDFAGVSDHVDCPRVTSGTISTISGAVWVRTSDSGSSVWFMCEYETTGNQRSWSMGMKTTGRFEAVISSDGTNTNKRQYETTSTINDGAWHHVAFTFDTGTLTLYIDGSEATVTKLTDVGTVNSAFDHSTTLCLGAVNPASPLGFFDGECFDFRVSSDAWTAAEVAELAAMGPGASTGPISNLLAHYKGDEVGGTVAYDSSGNGNHGTITAAAIGSFHLADGTNDEFSFQNEVGFTSVGLFDGTDDEVASTATNTVGAADQTMMCWIRGTGTSDYLLSTRDGNDGALSMWISSGGKLQPVIDTTVQTATSASINDGTWTHVAVVYDATGDSIAKYINGSLDGDDAVTGSPGWTTGEVYRFGNRGGGTSWFTGEACDVRHYTRALTADEISDIATAGTYPSDDDLELHWDFDLRDSVNADLLVIDKSGNGHHGTIAGSTLADFYAAIPRQTGSTNDIRGVPVQYSGKCPHDPIVSSPCVHPDGSTKYWVIDDHADFDNTDHVTWAFWCNNDNASLSVAEVPLSKYETTTDEREFEILFNSSDQLRVNFGATGGSSSGDWIDDNAVDDLTEDMFVVVTFDGGVCRAYINGIERTGTSTSIPTTLNNETADILIGATEPSTPANHWDGQIWDVRHYSGSSVPTPSEVLDMYENGTVEISGQTLLYHIPFCERAGAVGFDATGNGHDAVGPSAPVWATQNRSDYKTTNGMSIATNYSGTGEYLNKGSRLTSGALTELSFACWLWIDALGTVYIAGEEETTGNQLGWSALLDVSGALRFAVSGDGITNNIETTSATYSINTWYHFAAVYDGGAGAITLYVDGASVGSTQSGTVPASMNNTTADFEIGSANGGVVPWNGMLSSIVLEETAWSAATVAQIYAGTIPSTAWHWQEGDQSEFNQSLADLTVNGTPDEIHVPAGAELPATYGPNVIVNEQSLDLGGGEANSPYAQQLDAVITDLTYAQGDNDDPNDLFVNVDDGGEFDSKLVVMIPPPTGTDLTDLQSYIES